MKYAPNGAILVTVVGQNDLPHGLFAPDGSLRITQDVGQGLYAPNGAIRISTSGTAIYSDTGAWNGILVSNEFYPIWMSADINPLLKATIGSGNSDVLISGDASHLTFSTNPAQSGHTVLAASDTAQLRTKIAELLA